MRKILINIKDAVEISEEYKYFILDELKEKIDEKIRKEKSDFITSFTIYGYYCGVEYSNKKKCGFVKTAKVHNGVEYIIRIDFYYIDNKVILDII